METRSKCTMKKKCWEEEIYDNTYQIGILSELLIYTVYPRFCSAAKLIEPMNLKITFSITVFCLTVLLLQRDKQREKYVLYCIFHFQTDHFPWLTYDLRNFHGPGISSDQAGWCRTFWTSIFWYNEAKCWCHPTSHSFNCNFTIIGLGFCHFHLFSPSDKMT